MSYRQHVIHAMLSIAMASLFNGCVSPMWQAMKDGDIEKVKTFLEQGEDVNKAAFGMSPLTFTAYYGKTDLAKLLLDKGASIDRQSTNSLTQQTATPLFWAIDRGNHDTAKYLISRGASIDVAIAAFDDLIIKNPSGNTGAWKQNSALLHEWKKTRPAGSTAGSNENTIFMNDGSEIRGEIVNQNRTSITVKTKYTTMTIEKKNIKEIKYK